MAEAEDLEADAQGAYERHYVNNGNLIETKRLNEKEFNALIEFILLCQEKNVESILITTPVTLEYKEKIGVQYYDYSSDERFVHCYQYFMNADHLNCTGALMFTNILEREIINIKLH